MTDGPTHHVATGDEVAALLPLALARFGDGTEYEPVWMVNDETGQIDHCDLIDTERDRFARIDLIPDPETGALVPMSGDAAWRPLPDPEEV